MAAINAIDITSLLFDEGTAPSTPATTKWKLYFKTDGLYFIDDAGTETGPLGTGGGSTTFVGAKAYRAATQSISDITATAVNLDTELYDTSTFHDTVTNNTRMTVPTTGYYSLKGKLYWEGNASGVRTMWFLVNGTTVVRGSPVVGTINGTNAVQMITTADVKLTASDYVELIAYQNSGGAMLIGHATQADWQSTFSIAFLGT